MSWIDVQFIKQATEALMDCRPMLKWTYVYGYFLPETTNRDIFEYLQSDLEAGVERLSQLLEAKGDKDRVTIINATEYVRQRQKNLLQGLMENDIQGRAAAPEKAYVNTDAEQYDGWIYKAGS
jgi:ariadne-1